MARGQRLLPFRFGGSDFRLAGLFGGLESLPQFLEFEFGQGHLLLAFFRTGEFCDRLALLERLAGSQRIEAGDPVPYRAIDVHDTGSRFQPS